MPFEKTTIPDLILFTPEIYSDDRGYFKETYNQKLWEQVGVFTQFIQDNESGSAYGVLRGLHFQTGDAAQTKLVSVSYGIAQVAVVDLRKQSPTWGAVFSVVLNNKTGKQLYVPKGFAHGFLSLEDNTQYRYKVDGYRVPDAESGLDALDPELDIQWQLPASQIKRKGADKNWPKLSELKH